MIYRVEVSEVADDEVTEAYTWIYQFSPVRADTWFRGLYTAILSLSEFPFRCPLAPENEYFEEEIRQLDFGKRRNVYRILYTVRNDSVVILHVRHSARERLRRG